MKKIIKIILFIILLLSIIISLLLYLKNRNIPVGINNIKVTEDYQHNPNIKIAITNKSKEKDLENGKIYIEFYNKKKKIYTSEYEVNSIKKSGTLTIETICSFEHKEITHYKIKYNKYTIYEANYNPIKLK